MTDTPTYARGSTSLSHPSGGRQNGKVGPADTDSETPSQNVEERSLENPDVSDDAGRRAWTTGGG